mmetsp:Transcript_23970/g.35184  ORF Transcript_23970/g.35184 Transcript_23970/m.35184 type:complete len:932 (-) Transcript_23970:80-2875(-)
MKLCFIIDTHPSMQSNVDSMAAIDMCKCMIEQLLIRFRGAEKHLMLLKSGHDPSCLLATPGDTQILFERSLKNITCSSENHSLSYVLSLAFTTLGKYRIKTGVDGFGKGLMPWNMDPVTVVILTNGASTLANSAEMLWDDNVTSGELYATPRRWDHKVFTYALCEERQNFKGTPLYKLCVESGGGFHKCSGLKASLTAIQNLLPILSSPPFVSVNLSVIQPDHSTLANAAPNYASREAVGALFVARPGEWPLPEDHWVDRSIDTVQQRSAQLHIEVLVRERETDKSAFSSDQLKYMVNMARSNGLHIDCYEVSVISLHGEAVVINLHSSQPHKSSSSVNQDEKEVYEGCLGSRWCGVRVPGSQKTGSTSSPIFGVLCPSATSKRSDLLVLPYNFPVFLPLLQQARNIFEHQVGASANPATSLPSEWLENMGAYLRTVPPYYFPAMYKLFKPLRLHVFISILTGGATASPPSAEISLSRSAQKYLNQLTQRTKSELALLDPAEGGSALGSSWPGHPPSPSPPSSPASSHQNGDVDSSLTEYSLSRPSLMQFGHGSPYSITALGTRSADSKSANAKSVHVPTLCGAPPLSQDLLYTWEKIRGVLYGGSGATVRGMFVAGLHGAASGGFVSKDGQHNRDWFFKACGGASVPRLAVNNMSDYVSVLAQKEALRDPELLSPPADEDLPEGILKRKLAVNFGSPFKASRRRQGGISRGADSPIPESDGFNEAMECDIFSISSESTAAVESELTGEAQRAFALQPSLVFDENGQSTGDHLPPRHSDAYTIPKLKLRGSRKKSEKSNSAYDSIHRSCSQSDITADRTATTTKPRSDKHASDHSDEKTNGEVADETSSDASLPSIPWINVEKKSKGGSQAAQSPVGSTKKNVKQNSSGASSLSPSDNLPEGWVKKFSDKYHCDYWFNTLNGKSQWSPPKD